MIALEDLRPLLLRDPLRQQPAHVNARVERHLERSGER